MAPKNLELFAPDPQLSKAQAEKKPLADKVRPEVWENFQGLHGLDQNLLRQLRAGKGKPPSLILWGPPGSGKTTLARLIGNSYKANFIQFSAVLGGVKDVREIVAEAKLTKALSILFVDEIHRFNKGQQDAFLPHVEDGTIVLIGATTENPSFYLTSALLSRTRVLVLPSHSVEALGQILEIAARSVALEFDSAAQKLLVSLAGGDARRLLNLVESFVESRGLKADAGAAETIKVNEEEIKQFLKDSKVLFYDRSGEEHYNMVSAFIKSMRGSNADAALYWGFRMIESGEDPRFIIRRMTVFASEDIGNADPRALQVAVATSEAYEKLGLPEGRIPVAQCITYLATAPKSNRSYVAMNQALEAIAAHPKVSVPLHLRNAPTKLMKSLGYGDEYQYPHEFEDAFAAGVKYLPEEIGEAKFYEPSERGYEKTIKERLEYLKKRP